MDPGALQGGEPYVYCVPVEDAGEALGEDAADAGVFEGEGCVLAAATAPKVGGADHNV